MDYYGQPSAATVPTGRSPTWYEAVNSEFFYEQNQIQKMQSTNQHIYVNSASAAVSVTATNHSINVHEQPLANVDTMAKQQTHTNTNTSNNSSSNSNMEYYHRPMSMHFNNDANNYFPPPPLPPSSCAGDGNSMMTYPPCQGPRPWNFAQCYGFYGQPACSLLNIIDMEDFMWVSLQFAMRFLCVRKKRRKKNKNKNDCNDNRLHCGLYIRSLSGCVNKTRFDVCYFDLMFIAIWINQEIRVRAELPH